MCRLHVSTSHHFPFPAEPFFAIFTKYMSKSADVMQSVLNLAVDLYLLQLPTEWFKVNTSVERTNSIRF